MQTIMVNGQPIVIGSSASNVEVDDTLTKSTDNVLGVAAPFRGVFTQEQWDALSETERNTGLAIVDDGEEENVVVPGGSVANEDVYSTEETKIGTWIDGKPLYRKRVQAVTSTIKSWGTLYQDPLINIVEISATHYNPAEHATALVPYADSTLVITARYVDTTHTLQYYVSRNDMATCTMYAWIKYTKTTD